MAIWALSPLVLVADPTLFGLFKPHTSVIEFIRHTAIMWLLIAVGGLLFRTVHCSSFRACRPAWCGS